jgi:hypothetical protein
VLFQGIVKPKDIAANNPFYPRRLLMQNYNDRRWRDREKQSPDGLQGYLTLYGHFDG